jgi:photosystem II stability/assembly factor-like uncharacterized protein
MKQIVFYISLILLSSQSIAQPVPPKREDFWTPIETPQNFQCRSMAVNSLGWLFVGTADGVYRSKENGENLVKVGLNNVVMGLTVNMNDIIYAGSADPIYSSANNGDDWLPITTPSDVVCIFSNAEIILYGFNGGIYKSTNNGEDWTLVFNLEYIHVINSIVENTEGVIFAGVTAFMGGGGVFRSFDSGDTWEYCGLTNNYISSLAINSNGLLFAGSDGGEFGVFRSDNNGDTWVHVKNNVRVTGIAITPDNVVYISGGGVSRSFDSGDTWEQINTGLTNYNDDFLVFSPDGYLYLGARYEYGQPLFRSVNPVFTGNTINYSENLSILVYPNPFSQKVTIQLPQSMLNIQNVELEIYSIMGSKVWQNTLPLQQSFTVILSELNSGIYILSARINRMQVCKRIVKISN